MVRHNQLLTRGAEFTVPPHLDPETGADKPVEEDWGASPNARAADLGDPQGWAKYSEER
jgi:hypothetical protein